MHWSCCSQRERNSNDRVQSQTAIRLGLLTRCWHLAYMKMQSTIDKRLKAKQLLGLDPQFLDASEYWMEGGNGSCLFRMNFILAKRRSHDPSKIVLASKGPMASGLFLFFNLDLQQLASRLDEVPGFRRSERQKCYFSLRVTLFSTISPLQFQKNTLLPSNRNHEACIHQS